MKLPKSAVRINPPTRQGFVDRNKGQAIDDAFAISSQKALKPGRGPLSKSAVRLSEKPILNQFLENVGQTAINIPSSGLKYAKEMAYPVMHPQETVESLGNLASGVLHKTPFYPGVQDDEKYADAVGQHMKARYGGIDNMGRTLRDDPVGFLGDAAGLLTLGGMAPKMAKVGNVGRAIDPANLATRGVGKGIGSLTEGLSNKLYRGALKPSTPKDLGRRADVTRQMLDDKVRINQGGIDTLDRRIAGSEAQVQALIAPYADVTVPVAPIFNKAQAYLTGLLDDPAVKWKNVEAAQTQLDNLRQQMFDTTGSNISIPALQQVKRTNSTNTKYNKGKGEHSKTNMNNQVRKLIAKSAKETLEKKVPGLKKANAVYGKRLEARKPLEMGANRIGNLNPLPLTSTILGAAGAGVGGPLGAALGVGTGLVNNPAFRVNTAIGLNGLRRLPMDPGIPLSALSQGLLQSGRLASEE